MPPRRLPLFVSWLWVLGVLNAAAAAALPPPDGARPAMEAALERILAEQWRPEPTDPTWRRLKDDLDREIAQRPGGALAMLARRAAARVDIRATPVVSASAHLSSLALDLRPMFKLGSDLSYDVQVHASLNGADWIPLAAGRSGSTCGGRVIDLAWSSDIPFGFHRIELVVDIAYLAPARVLQGEEKARCGFRTAVSTNPPLPRPRAGEVLARERRHLPAISFGLFDTRSRLRSPGEATGIWTSQDEHRPAYDVFIQAAREVPAQALEATLPRRRFEAWLQARVDRHLAAPRPRRVVEWILDFCDPDEAAWYPGATAGDQSFWPASGVARTRRRTLCAAALVGLSEHRTLTVRLQVGTLWEGAGEWLLTPPAFQEAFISTGGASLDVPALSALDDLLAVPTTWWPGVDLVVFPNDITYTPVDPRPGDTVTVQVRIRNLGERDVPYAHGTLVLAPCCDRPDRVMRDFLRTVPVGDSVVVEASIALPEGSGWAAVCVEVWPPNGAGGGMRPHVHDRTPDDNCAGITIGRPMPDDGGTLH